jgi:hypothetical protein
MIIDEMREKLINGLIQLGIGSEDRPDALKSMLRAVKEAGARENLGLDEPVSWIFHFALDGSVSAEAKRDGHPVGVYFRKEG